MQCSIAMACANTVPANDHRDRSEVTDAGMRDAGGVSDAAAIGTLSCGELLSAWEAFVAAHTSCVLDSDCVVLGKWDKGSCGAPNGIGGALEARSSKEALPFVTRYFDAKCTWGTLPWDVALPSSAICDAGVCKAVAGGRCGP